ncbi:hypothetical protein BKI52_32720 [marine bacterium AO1-C]|nr:hypothetical protein BKI52_32720 [marine bacterium AO1-C]
MAIKVLIVDDEPIAREMIAILLQDFSQFEVLGEASNGQEALQLMQDRSPDLIFLDIQMPGLTGISLAEQLPKSFRGQIVFVTAYDEYALTAFNLNAIDYLLKPFTRQRFEQTITKVLTKIQQNTLASFEAKLNQLSQDYAYLKEQANVPNPQVSDQYLTRFVARQTNNKIVFIEIKEVEAIVGASDYIEVHHNGAKSLVNSSLNEAEVRLDPRKFIRIHRSYIIAIEQVKEIAPYFNGEYYFTLKNGQKYKSGRTYKTQVQKLLQHS